MEEITNKPEKEEVQKLQLYDVIDYLLSIDKEIQIRVHKILSNDLQLTNIKEAMKPLGVKSHNGVKNHKETVIVGNTIFAVLKGNISKY